MVATVQRSITHSGNLMRERENFYVLPKRLKCIYVRAHKGSFHVNAKCLGGIERMEAFHPGELQKCRYSNCNLLCGKSACWTLLIKENLILIASFQE